MTESTQSSRGFSPSAFGGPLSRPILLVLFALGIGRLSVVVVERLIQGVLLTSPQAFDILNVLHDHGEVDASRSLQQAFWLKEIL